MLLDTFHIVKSGSSMVKDMRRRVQKDTVGQQCLKQDLACEVPSTLVAGDDHLRVIQRFLPTELIGAVDKVEEVTFEHPSETAVGLLCPATDGPEQAYALLEKFGDWPLLDTSPDPEGMGEKICAYFAPKGAPEVPQTPSAAQPTPPRRSFEGSGNSRTTASAHSSQPTATTLPGLGCQHRSRI